jgi:flavorubredoxin
MVFDGFVETARLPRELAPGLTWFAVCTAVAHERLIVHSYHSLYLLSGADASLVVDTGNPKDWPAVERQLTALLAEGRPPLRYVIPTHTEVPHAGNLGRLLAAFPDVVAVGDVRDLHLAFPRFADRMRPAAVGDTLDLGGGRTFAFVTAEIRDLPTTLWGYDALEQVLFTADGFAYMHHHLAGECGRVAEEMPDLPLGEFSAVFNSYALYWTKFTDIRPHLERLEALMQRCPTRLIAPAHGSPICDPQQTVPKVKDGLLAHSPTA